MMQAHGQTVGCKRRQQNCITLLVGMTLLNWFQVCGAQSAVQAALTFAAQIVSERAITTPGELERLFFDPRTSTLLAECIQSRPYCVRLLDVSALASGRTRPRSAGASSEATTGRREPVAVAIPDYSAIVLACDFKTDTLYWTSGTIWGWGGYLHKTPLFPPDGKIVWKVGEVQSDHLHLLALGKQAGRRWLTYVKPANDISFPGIAYTDICQNSKVLQHTTPERGFMPRQALYVSATDQCWLVYGWKLCSLSGQIISLPGQTPPAQYNDNSSGDPVSVLDADSTGQFAYYADTVKKAIYKLRLSDGSLLATCRLTFAPTSLVLDEKRSVLHVADGAGRRICQVRLF